MSGGLDYRESGVDLDEARRSLDSITESVRSTFTPDVASDIGSFGGVFAGSFPGMDEPMLVSSIDGVGTKSMVAAMTGQFAGLGRDIVCHCIDDILVQGAKPLFFLDYFGAGRLTSDVLTAVVAGAAGACRENGVALLGGETAEMPGVYLQGEIDVVGSIVGVVDRKNMLPQPNIGTGDLVVGIASDGLHTNGFALARRALFERAGRRHDETIPVLGRSLGEELLRPHRSYYRAVEPMLSEDLIRGMAHITGGGLIENLPRALPPDCSVMIERRAWTPLPIFQMIQEDGSIADEEMFRVFNMGIGICLICRSEVASAVVQRLNDSGETAYVIGEVVKGNREVSFI
ncbi:MAG: phosphoribosylformylglycinamidine cyclo-ligase [Armatimonadota bacterium]|nr:phosphoribosylformylglycinamidine cyclo-ligase [Armatimonadota bacterium]